MSGIYIPGVTVPEDNTILLRIFPENDGIYYTEQLDIDEDILDKYFAIPVPDHGRLIDKDVMCKECRRVAEEYDGIYPDCTYCPAHLAPTIIPADKEGE